MAGLVLLAARWIVAAIFLRSGLSKVIRLAAFRSAVANDKILPAGPGRPTGFWLPFAEITAAVLLAAGVAAVAVVPPPTVILWRGPVGWVGVTATGGGDLPALLVVLLCLVMTALPRRAWTVRNLLRRY